jgi:hypothetical protein
MRLLQYINEEYESVLKHPHANTHFTIFKNPDRKELQELSNFSNQIRFVLDIENKDIYIWNYRLLHQYVANHLKFSYPSTSKYIYGEAEIELQSAKFEHVSLEYIHGIEALKSLDSISRSDLIKKWFLGKYFTDAVANIKPRLKSYKKHISEVFMDKYFDGSISNKIESALHLDEQYETTLQARFSKTSYEVFKNPTNKETFTAADNSLQSVRFIIDVNNKDIYMFDFRLLHIVVAKYLNFPYPTNEDYIYGQGVGLTGNKFKEVEFYDYVVGRKSKEKIKTLGWVKKWFVDLNNYISRTYTVTLD